jgi:hypothetical protein
MVVDQYAFLTLKWLVSAVLNPTYAQTTSPFSGVIELNNVHAFQGFSPNSGLGITITPGNLGT